MKKNKNMIRNLMKNQKKLASFGHFRLSNLKKNKTHKDASNDEYLALGAGGYIHKSDIDKFNYFLEVVEPKLKKEFVSNIDINDLIKYELNNHECYYTGDYYCIVPIIADYLGNYNYEEVSNIVKKVYFEEVKKYNGRQKNGKIKMA